MHAVVVLFGFIQNLSFLIGKRQKKSKSIEPANQKINESHSVVKITKNVSFYNITREATFLWIFAPKSNQR